MLEEMSIGERECVVEGDLLQVVCELSKEKKRIVVITPLEEGLDRIGGALSSRGVEATVSRPRAYLKRVSPVDVVVVDRPEVIREMGLDEVVGEIKKRTQALLVVMETSGHRISDLPYLSDPVRIQGGSKERYFIKIESETEKYMLLYAAVKLKMVKGSTVIVESDEQSRKKSSMFLAAFGLRSEEAGRSPGTKVALALPSNPNCRRYKNVIDFSMEVPPETGHVIYVGSRMEGARAKEYKLDFKGAGGKYRVESVLKALTPGVLKGREKIDLEKSFKHLRREHTKVYNP
jgi:hypothetical protein